MVGSVVVVGRRVSQAGVERSDATDATDAHPNASLCTLVTMTRAVGGNKQMRVIRWQVECVSGARHVPRCHFFTSYFRTVHSYQTLSRCT